MMRATVIGAGVAGLACAVELAERGAAVEVIERGATLGVGGCSWHAGGMLAPWCERESAEAIVARLGEESIGWWASRFPGTVRRGSLVLAHGRDAAELRGFARKTERYEWVGREQIATLEPDLAGRFNSGLYFESEAHLDPRAALSALAARLAERGGAIRFAAGRVAAEHVVVDCRGLAARDVLTDLRGVKGEMLLLRQPELSLSRPVRILHPRIPVYVVPRGDGLFMVGATMIESDDATRVTARSVLELLSAAYALHAAFGEAEVVEIGTGVRPAFPDNLPRIRWHDGVLHINGLYRHGFLLAPALARIAADGLLEGRWDSEVMDENHPQRRSA
jgi:glycine oxidase